MNAPFLVDKSALARWHRPLVAAALDPLHERGLLAICPAVEYELMYSIRGKSEAPAVAEWLRGFDYFYGDDWVFDRALEVQRAAIERGFHRTLSLPDLLVAATAERNDATVLHHDADYDMIASLTGQRCQWVVEPGTAD
ncbi:PIN domain nuclease [Streptomyces ureilyticus]|uniref:Ribonuclease VapC n=1 Tax=Streptomyces ureilyticus TaxID=1775131 RepID=A0ABX0DPA7_9ACTN|nr:PIN domain nuclease [Streptomyces ureilyticus]NGO42545.1 PIN domain nuclease [Streptomyces ureilyticus]